MSLTGSVEASDNMRVLRGKIKSLSPYAVDPTLSASGAAAEAKATGDAISEVSEAFNAHNNSADNPHKVTKKQIGLGNVDNTADEDKPISTAQAVAIADAKKAGTDAQAALELKVDVEAGKGLSTNDFTDEYKAKLDGIEENPDSELTAGCISTTLLADGAVTAEKMAANAVRIRATDVKVEKNTFVEDTADSEYKYRGAAYVTGAKDTMKPEVTFDFAEVASGIFSPVCESFDGGVYIYANAVPDKDITLPVVELWR